MFQSLNSCSICKYLSFCQALLVISMILFGIVVGMMIVICLRSIYLAFYENFIIEYVNRVSYKMLATVDTGTLVDTETTIQGTTDNPTSTGTVIYTSLQRKSSQLPSKFNYFKSKSRSKSETRSKSNSKRNLQNKIKFN